MNNEYFFYIFLNGRLIGFYVANSKWYRAFHGSDDMIIMAMGFNTVNDYVASIPGYNHGIIVQSYEEQIGNSFVAEPSYNSIEKTNTKQRFQLQRVEYPNDDRHINFFEEIHSYGSWPFILPLFEDMRKLKRYGGIKDTHIVFSCCYDWNENQC